MRKELTLHQTTAEQHNRFDLRYKDTIDLFSQLRKTFKDKYDIESDPLIPLNEVIEMLNSIFRNKQIPVE